MNERQRVFVSHPLMLSGGPAGAAALEPLLAAADCEVWAGPGRPTPADLLAATRDCDGLLCLLTDRIDAELIQACSKLRAVSSVSVGVDHIDLDAATRRGIQVGHTPGVLAETTADLSFGLMLAAARRIVEADRFLRAGEWVAERRWEPDMLLGRDLYGATLGVIGLGAIGQAVARRAQGFGMRVLGWTPSRRAVAGVEAVELDALLSESDFVSIHVALSDSTRGLIDGTALARMRPDALLVNSARGGIVDELALVAALRAGKLGGAALDVFADEPIGMDSPLLSAPNLVLTPHIGSASVRTRYRMAALAVQNLLAGLTGQPMTSCANRLAHA